VLDMVLGPLKAMLSA